jgi:hypothetical protein
LDEEVKEEDKNVQEEKLSNSFEQRTNEIEYLKYIYPVNYISLPGRSILWLERVRNRGGSF